jgi:hypothetical protein
LTTPKRQLQARTVKEKYINKGDTNGHKQERRENT